MQPIEVVNPRSGERDYRFVPPSAEELAATCGRLRLAQPAWRDSGIGQRIEVLQAFKAALERHRGAIVEALSADTGRRLLAASEVSSTIATIDRWCREAPGLLQEAEGRSTQAPALRFRNQWVPYPLVGVISPWNFPLVLAFIDAIPALLAGCAVFIKPSEITPRFADPVRKAIEDVPELAAVLALQAGAGEAGAALVPRVDAICFTGSVGTGRIVAEAAAKAFIPAFLELGGKDPVVVTETADLDLATTVVLRASVLSTGQACQSLERVYVQERVYDEFVARLVEKAQRVTINWPDPHRGEIGPFIWGRQADIVQEQIDEAVARGARVLCGGQVEEHGGKWLRPTVIVDVDHDMKLMREETFGPVMPVMRYRDAAEAIRHANEGVYGLSAAVIAGTEAEAEAIARHIDAGGISINDGALTGVMHECEKNSFKCSGMGGTRMGPGGFTRFFRKKALIFQSARPLPIEAFDESNA